MPAWMAVLRLTGLGWYVAVAVAGGVVAGKALDNWLDTGLVFTLLGLVLGIITASFGTYHMLLPILRSSRGGKGYVNGREEE